MKFSRFLLTVANSPAWRSETLREDQGRRSDRSRWERRVSPGCANHYTSLVFAVRTMGPKIFLQSLGCPKNLVDSELMLGMVTRGGGEIVLDPEAADVLIVNTCGFIG